MNKGFILKDIFEKNFLVRYFEALSDPSVVDEPFENQ